ncbi:ATP-binding protein [Streptomyces sp. DSM 44917]|uniref:ATP-binding protein n=1 Tax=Streptomyces boetiae TaxID=3075541 RepID=A0ABU2L8B0_9ACTN|nr:ATP-binding protein [Streptomyces sp. DSM 44917]MDT0307706.1 ATP-binding protein [Streptomyces sp. DSM 44917]
MSHPLKRRMARAALLLAAGAAPVIAAAGQASADSHGARPSGLAALEGDGVAEVLEGSVGVANELAAEAGGDLGKAVMPVAGPVVEEAGSGAARTTGNLVGGVSRTVAENGPSPEALVDSLPSMDRQLNNLSL